MTVMLYGVHPVLEALTMRPRAVRRVVLARASERGPAARVAELAGRQAVPVRDMPPGEIAALVRSPHHQGVAAETEPFPLLPLEQLLARCRKGPGSVFLLLLDSIQDPQNVGALLRSAVCSGVQGVIFPKDRSAGLTGAVARASAGAIEHVPLCRVVNLVAALQQLKQRGIWTAAAVPRSRQTVYEFDCTADLALVLGNEEKGVRPLVRRTCDVELSIPLAGGFDSLNASVAGAVLLFEVVRQRRAVGLPQ